MSSVIVSVNAIDASVKMKFVRKILLAVWIVVQFKIEFLSAQFGSDVYKDVNSREIEY